MSETADYATIGRTTPPRAMPTTFARQGEEIKRLQSELDETNKRLTDANGSVNQWMEYFHNAEADNAALLLWAKEAYTRLQSLMTIGVSMTPDAVTAKLLQDAPDGVKGETK